MSSREDFSVRMLEYLKDKFPGHKLSDYEEASAYTCCQIIMETNRQIHEYIRIEKKGHRPT
jgi:hypothetical protein